MTFKAFFLLIVTKFLKNSKMCDFGLKTQLFRLNKTKKSKNFFKKVFKISYIEDSIFDTF